MPSSFPNFTQPQWEFLSTIAAFDMPVSLDVVSQLVLLPLTQFLELMRKCESLNWIYQAEDGSVGLIKALPEVVQARILKNNSHVRLSGLIEKIESGNMVNTIPPRAYENLKRLAGEKADLKNEMALVIEALKDGKKDEAQKNLNQIDLLLSSLDLSPSESTWFISESIKLAEYCILHAVELFTVIEILNKTISIAKEIGDERSRAMANFILGRAYWYLGRMTEAVHYLGLGKEKAEELGDPDILTYASCFIGLYYCLRGYLNKAASYLKAVTQYGMQNEEYTLAYEAPVLLLYCDINRGDFHQAVGTIDFFRRSAIKRKDYYTAALYRGMLGITLWAIGKREEALFHLEGCKRDALAADNTIAYWVSLHGLSCLYLSEGDIARGLPIFKEAENVLGKAGYIHHVFHPLYLECYFKAEQAGCEFPPEWHFDALFERFMAEPNIDLQGVVLRLRAVRAIAAGENDESILKDLQESESLLEKCEDVFQLAKTKIEMVRYYLRNNDYKKATSLANDVYYRELTGYSEKFFPDDLGFLLERTNVEPSASMDYSASIEPILNILEELFSAPDDAMKMELFLSTLSRFFRAERAGIFVFNEAKEDMPELQTARNLSRSIISEKNFRQSIDMIRACFKKKKPIISKNTGNIIGAIYKGWLSAMCLPILNEAKIKLILYFDNSYLPDCFDFVSMPMLESLGRHLAAIIEKQEIGKINITAPSKSTSHSTRGVLHSPPVFSGMDMIIKDQKMIRLLNKARHLAESEAPILIQGETGSGKEVVAQWIHYNSLRREKPFVIVDLTTIPENLAESELFGHEKGAFTGAYQQKIGRVEMSEGGTLFFDEIGEISTSLQIKLLRLLETHTFVRVGGTKVKQADFRLVAATNRNLFDEVKGGRFREDLYYRLNALELTIPPLRDRKDDMIALAQNFLNHYAKKYNKKIPLLSEEQIAKMVQYNWPGNVRELKHVIERAVLVSEDNRLELDFPNSPASPAIDSLFTDFPTLDEVQRRYIQFVLSHTKGKIGGPGNAADILDVNRTTLNARLRRLGIR